MLTQIKHFLKEPYPFYYQYRSLIKLIPFVLIFGTLLLYIFQPFNREFSEHKYSYIVICLVHSLIASLCILPFFLIARFKVKDESKWTIGKELILMLCAFTAVGIGNYLIRDLIYDNNYNKTLRYLFEEIRNAFLIGIAVYPLLVWFNSRRLTTKHTLEGDNLSQQIVNSENDADELIEISSSAGTVELRVSLNKLQFIKAEGNYVQVYYQDTEIRKKLIRNTLSQVAILCPDFFKPHRSYLVNMDQVSHIGGNSQGYTLHFDGSDVIIPVSRSKKKDLIHRYDSTKN